MLSIDIFNFLKDIDASFDEAVDLFAALDQFDQCMQTVDDYTDKLLRGDQSISSADFRNTLNASLNGTASEISPKLIFMRIDELKKRITTFREAASGKDPTEVMLRELEKISLLYERYMQSRNVDQGLELVRATARFGVFLKGYKSGLGTLSSVYQDRSEKNYYEEELSIQLYGEITIDELIAKLSAVKRMYDELCSLRKVSLTDRPLRIAKIETGSLLVSVLGDPITIGFVASSLGAAATYLIQRFTRQGRVESTGDLSDSLEKILNVRDRLNEIGVDTSEIDIEVRNTAVHMAKDVRRIVAGQSKVVINGEVYSVEQELKKQIALGFDSNRIEHSPIPRIGQLGESDEDTVDNG